VLAVKREIRPKHHYLSSSWSKALEGHMLAENPKVELLKSRSLIEERQHEAKSFAIDIDAGVTADRHWNPDWWQ